MITGRRQVVFLAGAMFTGLLILAVGGILAQVSGERVTRGIYSLNRAEPPARLVTGVSLPELTRVHFPEMSTVQIRLRGKWGRAQTLFRQEDGAQVRITVAVYASAAEAEDAALELLDDTSARMKSGSRGGGAIGTHSWYLDSPGGQGTVVFVGGNSLFQVFSSSYGMAEASARSIAADVQRGANGVRLGRRVSLPSVQAVRLGSPPEVGAEVRMTIEATDPAGRQLAVFGSSVAGQLLDTAASQEKIFIPTTRQGEIRLYAINDLNVVSAVYVHRLGEPRKE